MFLGRANMPFKKGQSGNPGGRKRMPQEIKELTFLTKQRMIGVLNQFLYMTKDEIQAKLQDPNINMLEMAIGHIIAKAAKDGDQTRLNFVFDRIVGKVTDVTSQVNKEIVDYNPDDYKEVPREALLKLVEAVKK